MAAKDGTNTTGVICDGELYTLSEFRRRMDWQEHALRQARKAGLRVIPFGRAKYVLGSDALAFFERLAEGRKGGATASRNE